jgi:hypothetical protein
VLNGEVGLGVTGLGLAGEDAAVELVDDAGDVGAGLAVGRDAVVLVDGGGAGVVGGESEGEVVVVVGEESVDVGGATADVLLGLESVVDAEVAGGGGHELHEASGAGAADGLGVAVGLGFDDAGEEVDVEVVVGAGAGEDFGEVGGAEGGGLLTPRLQRRGLGYSRFAG